MSIRRVALKDGTPRWQARVTLAGRRASALCANRAEARQMEATLYRQLIAPDDHVRSPEALIEWLGAPSVDWDFERISMLRRPMVYAWVQGDAVLYVGMSTEGVTRPLSGTHHRREDLVGRLLCWSAETPADALRLEADVIRRCAPRLNIQRKVAMAGGNGEASRRATS